MTVKIGRIYRYYPNGDKSEKEIVRVTRIGMYATTVGAHRFSTPYNFAMFNHFGRATKTEIQEFVERMPLR